MFTDIYFNILTFEPDMKFIEPRHTLSAHKGVCKGGGFGVNPPPLNLLCYKNVITYAKEFVYVFVHFLLV